MSIKDAVGRTLDMMGTRGYEFKSGILKLKRVTLTIIKPDA